jgi:hypothetical protein
MAKTPEEQYLHELIESYVAPLRSEIKELRKRIDRTTNLQYHPDKWLCTYHANKAKIEGRRKRKYGNRNK